MSNCPECLRAKQRVVHMDYAVGCRVCGARELAYMAREDREKVFDAIERDSGICVRREAERMTLEERARIDALAEALSKERVP